jgi:putative iron-dependent peroxidase
MTTPAGTVALNSTSPVDPGIAQDIYKDVGRQVNFTVLNLVRKDQTQERALIEEFCDKSQAIIRSLRVRADRENLLVAIGFSNQAWDWLFPGAPKPKELQNFDGLTGNGFDMPGTGGDIFLHVRADSEAVVFECMSQFMEFLRPITTVLDETHGFRYLEGRAIIGFIDGTEAPSGSDSPPWAIVGDEDPEFVGGSYSFLQKWIHNMDYWDGLSTEAQERAIGRRKYSDLELADDQKSQDPAAHNIAAKLEIDGEEKKIIRTNVAFSNPAKNETGTMFIGYSRHWEITKKMLIQMLDKKDFLLTFSQIVTGQLFFIPSRDLLGKMADGDFAPDSPEEADIEIVPNPA